MGLLINIIKIGVLLGISLTLLFVPFDTFLKWFPKARLKSATGLRVLGAFCLLCTIIVIAATVLLSVL